MTRDPFATRLSLFTGKGGVGKTTVVAALATEAARRGRRPLVVELGHRASMQAVFGVPHIGHTPVEVSEGVFATNIDLDAALRDYIADHVPIAPLAKRIAESRSMAKFFEAAPAVGEVLTLQRLEQLLDGPWDPVLVDFDATGHALMFLELPRVFDGLVSDGPVHRLLESFAGLLSDPDRTAIHLVTLPAALPVQETVELYETLRDEHAVRRGCLYVNRMPAPPASPVEAISRWLERIPEAHPARADLALLSAQHRLHRRAQTQLRRLRSAVDMPHIPLPAQASLDLAALGRIAGAS